MAFGDIIILNPDQAPIEHYPVTASETFDIGEWVTLTTAGTVSEISDDDTSDVILGVSAGSGDTTATATSATGIGVFRYTSLGDFVPGDNAAQTGDLVPVYLGMPQVKFATRNFATDGSGTDVTPTTANAQGERGGATVDAGIHSVDLGATAGSDAFFVMDVLDTNMIPIELSGGTGVWVVFRQFASQVNRAITPA